MSASELDIQRIFEFSRESSELGIVNQFNRSVSKLRWIFNDPSSQGSMMRLTSLEIICGILRLCNDP